MPKQNKSVYGDWNSTGSMANSMIESNDKQINGGVVAHQKPHEHMSVLKILAIVVSAIVVIVAVYAVIAKLEYNSYLNSVITAKNIDKSLTETINDAEQKIKDTKVDEVADASMLDEFESILKSARNAVGVPTVDPHKLAIWQIINANSQMEADIFSAQQMVDAVKSMINQIEKSEASKSLDDAKNTLKDNIDSAAELLTNSGGKVADDSTRDALSKAISEANGVYSMKGVTDPNIYTEQSDALESAMDAVVGSQQRKSEADAAADQAHCKTIADKYSLYQGSDIVHLNEDCGFNSEMGSQWSGTYVPNSFKQNTDRTMTWQVSGSRGIETITFYPSGVYSPLFAKIEDQGYSMQFDRLAFSWGGYIRGIL